MPLFGDRLFKSETWISATAEARVAMLRLWWHSYSHEVPAASLPNNDQLLAEYAGYGVMVKAWRKVRVQVMRGFLECSDGRLYHPMVADLAKDGWKERLRNREKQRAWRERNASKAGDVTVTEVVTKPVTQPLCNAGEGQREGQGQGQSPSLRSGEDGAAKPRPARPVGESKTLTTYLTQCRDAKAKPVPDDHYIRPECEAAGVTPEMLQVAWVVFRRRYTEEEKGKGKRYKDWPGHFAKSVREGWLKVWYIDPATNQANWTSTGLQLKAVLDSKAKSKDGEA